MAVLISLTVEGEDQIAAALKQAEFAIEDALLVGAENWMKDTGMLAVALAPVKTGALRASVYANMDKSGQGELGFAARYAALRHETSSSPFYLINAVSTTAMQLRLRVAEQLRLTLKGKHAVRSASPVPNTPNMALARSLNPSA